MQSLTVSSLLKTSSPLEIFVLSVFVFSEIEMVMINW